MRSKYTGMIPACRCRIGMGPVAFDAILFGGISMIDLACPNCGRAGSIPREKINTRLVCKKCHVAFHMNTAGRTLLGEPHQEVGKPEVVHHHSDPTRLSTFENLGGIKESL